MSFNMHNNLAMTSAMAGIPQQIASTHYTEDEPEEFILDEEQEGEDDASPEVGNEGQAIGSAPAQSRGAARGSFSRGQSIGDSGSRNPYPDLQPIALHDNTNQIYLRYQKTAASLPQPQAIPDARMQRTQIINNMRKMVEVEYKQFVKGPKNSYSKAGLRTILQSLQPKKKVQDGEETKGAYNYLNVTRAAKTLNIVQEESLKSAENGSYL